LASGNPGKLGELQAMLGGLGLDIVPQSRFAVPEVAETGLTFVENALIKARHCAEVTGLPAIADDSGLVVDALHGAPGIYSARYAGVGASDEQNVQKLLDDISGVAEARRSARFYCVLVYLRHPRDPMPVISEGVWGGRVLEAPVGGGGFGYDPVFYVPDQGCSAAQLGPAVKNRISHRGQALTLLTALLGLET
jgi:XTP/dITP diphosphohydrolase